MADKVNICLVSNNQDKVDNISDIEVYGMRGGEPHRQQDINVTLIKDTKEKVTHIKGVSYIARDLRQTKTHITVDDHDHDDVKAEAGSSSEPTKEKVNNKQTITISNIKMTGTINKNKSARNMSSKISLVRDSKGGIGNISNVNFVAKDFTN